MNLPLGLTFRCHPRKSKPSVLCTSFVLASLTFRPLDARKSSMRTRKAPASSLGCKMYTTSSAYRNPRVCPLFSFPLLVYLIPRSSNPCRTKFARSGLITPLTMLQRIFTRGWSRRTGSDSEHYIHLPLFYFNLFDQGANEFTLSCPVHLL